MKKVVDVIFKPQGIVAKFSDGSLVEGKYRTINGQLRLIGISPAQRTALHTFYNQATNSADADLRFFALKQGGGGSAPGPPGPPGPGFKYQEDELTVVSNGQTTFILSKTFVAGGYNMLTVNGTAYAEVTDYTIVGTTLTWLDTDFALDTTDELIARYEHL